MKTYLSVWLNSDGASPSEITQRLLGMGFRPMKGNYDYVYDWNKKATIDEAINLAEQVHQTLKGLNVLFKLESL